jgi:hypothetical protein
MRSAIGKECCGSIASAGVPKPRSALALSYSDMERLVTEAEGHPGVRASGRVIRPGTVMQPTGQVRGPIIERSVALMARRRRNFEAMKSPASIALGIGAIVLVTLVCAFYDHPTMHTPQILSSLHSWAVSNSL